MPPKAGPGYPSTFQKRPASAQGPGPKAAAVPVELLRKQPAGGASLAQTLRGQGSTTAKGGDAGKLERPATAPAHAARDRGAGHEAKVRPGRPGQPDGGSKAWKTVENGKQCSRAPEGASAGAIRAGAGVKGNHAVAPSAGGSKACEHGQRSSRAPGGASAPACAKQAGAGVKGNNAVATGAGDGTRGGAGGAQKHDNKATKKPEPETPVLFTSDSQSFPMLDLSVPPPAAKGPWAAGSSSAGRWSRPLDIEASHSSGEMLRQKPPQQQKQPGEQEWITVAPKPKPGTRPKTPASPSHAHAPSAWGGWGARDRDVELHGQVGAPPKSARVAPHPPGPAAGAAPNEAKRPVKKAPIMLSELIPVLRRKDVKMPTPYTSQQQVEMGSSKNRDHKRTENLVRNPNTADSTKQYIVLRRKEREGGSKKKKISPLKKLILRDRKERLERQAAACDAAASHGAESTTPEEQSAGNGGDAGDGTAVGAGGPELMADEASQLAVEWLHERGMDPSNPEHVQQLLDSLNEEEEEEEEDDDECDENNEEGAKQRGMSQFPLSQLPSAVSWTQQLHRATLRERAQSPDHGAQTAPTKDGEMAGVASCSEIDGRAIPRWAQVNAPEFRPAAAPGPGHAHPRLPPPSPSRSASEASLAVSAGWAAQSLSSGPEGAASRERQPAAAAAVVTANDNSSNSGGGGSGVAKAPKKKGRGRGSEGSDGASNAEGKEAAKQSEPAAQKQKVVVTTGSVNQGDGKSVLLVCCSCVAPSAPSLVLGPVVRSSCSPCALAKAATWRP
jgi:hypothetical protein